MVGLLYLLSLESENELLYNYLLNMADVLLINPKNVFDKERSRFRLRTAFALYPPLGILYLASILKKSGISVKVVDSIAMDHSLADIKKIIKYNSPKVVGITATTPQVRGALQLATLIKQHQPNIVVGIGGAHVTADKHFIEKFKAFDFSVVGEGESIFHELVNKALKGKKIKGIYNGAMIKDINTIPFPPRELLDKGKYFIEPYGSSIATIHTTRGCPFNCVFCSKPITCRTTRFRTPKNVIDEIIECIEQDRVKMILFTDDTFTLDRRRTINICRRIISRGIKIDWSCETRASLVDEPLIKIMKKAGCKEIAFGVETGNEKLRIEVIRKGVTDQELITAFDLCRQYGIKTSAFCMLGFPGETKADMYKTLDLSLRLKPDIFGLHLTTLMPGADIYNIALKEKKIKSDIWDKYARGSVRRQPIYVPDKLTLKELKRIQKEIYQKYYFRFDYILSRIIRDIKSHRLIWLDVKMAANLLINSKTSTGRQ